MISYSSILLLTYLIGGFTLLPTLIIAFCIYSYYVLPHSPIENDQLKNYLGQKSDGKKGYELITDQNAEVKCPSQGYDPVAAYFTVCREYFPGGVNHRSSERTTIAGSTTSNESLNVYQSMYRSIFDRNKSQVPIIDGSPAAGKPNKKVRNVFLIILRYVPDHGNRLLVILMLIDMAT